MGVDRTDYLIWGAKVDPDAVDYDKYEAELNGEPGRRFDLIYDGMSGDYAVAGRVVAESKEHEGLAFHEILPEQLALDPDVVTAVTKCFSSANRFSLYLFSHFH